MGRSEEHASRRTFAERLYRFASTKRRLFALWLVQLLVIWVLVLAWSANVATVTKDGPWGGFDCDAFFKGLTNGWLVLGLFAAIVFSVQALFLLPIRMPRAKMARGRSMWVSVAVATTCIALLVGGLVVSILDVARFAFDGNGVLLLVGLGVSWVVFFGLLVAYVRRRPREAPESLLATIARRIFRGTIIEVLAIVPLDLVLRERDECYCAAPTLFTFIVCIGVGTVFLGPAILLPLLFKSRAVTFYRKRCDGCAAPLDQASASPTSYRARAVPICATCGLESPNRAGE